MGCIRTAFLFVVVFCLLSEAFACGRGGGGGGGRKPRPNPDTRPPNLVCPQNINAISKPIQNHAEVNWTEPTAYDNEMKKNVPTTRTGMGPGFLFNEGTTTISYSAKDNSGNNAHCDFKINVTVPRCSFFGSLDGGWKWCHPSTDMRYGGYCRFGCHPGHVRVGAHYTTCRADGTWTAPNKPYCRKIQCSGDQLYPSADQAGVVTISCTDSNNYLSQCSYVCEPGYSVKHGQSKVIRCGANGSWMGSTPVCVDTRPPEFSNCPVVVRGYAERTKASGRVSWSIPQATDNSGSVTIVKTPGPDRGDEFPVGEHDVTYTATDETGNSATCQFKVVVKQILCPEIFPLPFTSVTCPTGRIYGSSCQFACDGGTASSLPLETTCDRWGTNYYYGLWDFGDHQPFCEQQKACPDLRAPDNGALACDTWMAGRFCQMMCQDGYTVFGNGTKVHSGLLVCGDTGTWYISGEIPDCEKLSDWQLAFFVSTIPYGYYNGSCEDAVDEIRQNFIKSYENRGYNCSQPECSLGNIKVICGASEESKDRKRNTESFIAVELEMELSPVLDFAASMAMREELRKELEEAREAGDLDIIVGGKTLKPGPAQLGQLKVTCPEGSVPAPGKPLACIQCGPGTYQDTGVEPNVCRKCAIGSQQTRTGQTSCDPCPPGMTTEKQGATECKEACPKGSTSPKGTPPCTPCDIGRYSDEAGTRECQICPGSKTTSTPGSTSVSACYDFDVVFAGQTEVQGFVVPSVQANTTMAEEFDLSMWFKAETDGRILEITDDTGADFLIIDGGDILTVTVGSTAIPGVTSTPTPNTWAYLYVSWSRQSAAAYVDGELVATGSHSEALPTKLHVSFGEPGFTGSVSQLNMFSVTDRGRAPRGGTCFAAAEGDLVAWRSFANLDGSFEQMRSKCDAFDNCQSDPCQYNGTCTDAIDGYTCACADGFTGSDCSENVDDCEGNVCDNGGACVDGVGDYTCSCAEGFTGKYCDMEVVDGAWGEFGNWTVCNVACGTGYVVRNRTCDSPAPSNGGKNCSGLDYEIKDCVMEPCVNECKNDPGPIMHGNVNCTWEGDTRKCYPTCDDGYDFDDVRFIDPPNIRCGPETGNRWNFCNEEENPYCELSECREKMPGKKNIVYFDGTYGRMRELTDGTKPKVQETLINKAEQTDCVARLGRCTVDGVDVRLENYEDSRRKRSTSAVTFTISISCDIYSGIDECYDLLAAVVTELNDLVDALGFTVTFNGDDYDVDVNSTDVDGTTICDAGYVPVLQYCISCGTGMYQNGEFCDRCALGFYQDEAAKQSCKPCPKGWTTAGLQTRDVALCNVEAPTEEEADSSRLVLIVASVVSAVSFIALIAVILGVCVYIKKTKKTKVEGERSTTPIQVGEFSESSDFNGNVRFPRRASNPYDLFTVTLPPPLPTSSKKAPIAVEETSLDDASLPNKVVDAKTGSLGQYDNPLYDVD